MTTSHDSIAIFELRVPFSFGDSIEEPAPGQAALEKEARMELDAYLERKLGETSPLVATFAALLRFADAIEA